MIRGRVPASFVIMKREAAGSGQPLLVNFLVFRFTVPVAEVTTGPEWLFLCLRLRFLYNNLTAIEL